MNTLVIQKITGVDKLYIYRSNNSDDINTISKVSNLEPIIIIDQNVAPTSVINDKECFLVNDKNEDIPGVTYNGPNLNIVKTQEYESSINIVKLNSYTFVNELILNPLEINHKDGIIYYYSIIGIDEENSLMTHLSKVNGTLYEYSPNQLTSRQVWSCNDYQDDDNKDVWTLVNTIEYNESNDTIRIGDTTNLYEFEQLGNPFIETVPQIQNVKASLNSLISDTFMLLEVQNPWQNNNKEFNYRKLKSFKIRNVFESIYGEFSTPTYQSELPVSIEKMVILMKTNPEDQSEIIDINDTDAERFEIIRRDGLFYNQSEHKQLSFNKWTIPVESNMLNVFSESSIQDTINIQISAVCGNLYVFDIYLIDVYRNVSSNTHYVLET